MFSLDPSPFAVSTKTRSRPSPSAPGSLSDWKERVEGGQAWIERQPVVQPSFLTSTSTEVMISSRICQSVLLCSFATRLWFNKVYRNVSDCCKVLVEWLISNSHLHVLRASSYTDTVMGLPRPINLFAFHSLLRHRCNICLPIKLRLNQTPQTICHVTCCCQKS